jgi:hypothetical protein
VKLKVSYCTVTCTEVLKGFLILLIPAAVILTGTTETDLEGWTEATQIAVPEGQLIMDKALAAMGTELW